MTTRRAFLGTLAGGVLAPLMAGAQQPGRVWRIGFLAGGARTPDGAPPAPLRQALQALGYVEGKDVTYVGRWAEAKRERLPGLAAELVGLKVDLIVTRGGPSQGRPHRCREHLRGPRRTEGDHHHPDRRADHG